MSTSTTSGFLHDLSIEQISHILQCAQDIGSDSSEVFTILRGQKRSIDERIANRRSRLVELEDETGQIQDEIRSLGKQLVQCKSAISNANRLASATPTRTCKRAIDEVEDSNLDEALLDRKTRRRRVQPGSNDPGTALVPNVGVQQIVTQNAQVFVNTPTVSVTPTTHAAVRRGRGRPRKQPVTPVQGLTDSDDDMYVPLTRTPRTRTRGG